MFFFCSITSYRWPEIVIVTPLHDDQGSSRAFHLLGHVEPYHAHELMISELKLLNADGIK